MRQCPLWCVVRGLSLAAVVGVVMSLWAAPPAAATAMPAVTAAVPDSAPDSTMAARDAQQGHKRVLDSATITETSQTFANPDGSWTRIEYAQPVRVRQAGGWVPVDTTLVRSGNSIGPKAAVISLALNPGGKGSAATPIVVAGTNGNEVGLTWPSELPVPVLSGDTATYPDVLPGVDLTVAAQATGYAETMVVRTRQAANDPALAHLTFGVYTRNASVAAVRGAGQGQATRPRAIPPDGLQVLDRTGKVPFDGDASRMWDSSRVTTRSGPNEGHRQATMGVRLATGSVMISPDLAFLTDPATTYPVSLDPDTWCTSCGIQHHDVVQSGFPTARNYDATAGALGTLKAGWESQDPAATSRSYVEMDTSAIAGTVVKSASLNTTVTHTWNCAGATSATDLYWTSPIDGTTTWAKQPGWNLLLSSNNTANCQDAGNVSAQFDATRAAQDAANSRASGLTMMLAADNECNDVATWRLFALNPYLQVDYDSYPNTPANLSMQNGSVPCVQGAGRPWVFTRTPQLAGQVSDPDGGTLDVAFGLDQGTVGNLVPGTHQTNNASTVIGTPGPNGAALAGFTVPSGWIPQDGTYTWLMSASDGQLWSANSASCEFTVDSAVPLAPSVSMTGTAPVNQGDTAHFSVSVGVATAGLDDIDHFIYTTDGSEPSPQSSPRTAANQLSLVNGAMGATATLAVTAVNGNQNYIKIKAVNRAGTPGPDATCVASPGGGLDAASCSYHVLPLTPSTGLVGAWSFDELAGRTLNDTANTTPGNAGQAPHLATLIGGGGWVPGYDHGDAWSHPDTGGYSDGPEGALTLDGGTAYGQTSGQVLDTTKSFTVSAWAKISDTSSFRTILSQDGNQASGFYLQYSLDDHAWAFSMVTGDVAGTTGIRALSTSPPQLNVWTHLVGTYDASTGLLTLYVNGVEQHTAMATGFGTTGPLVIGVGKWNGARVDYFDGQIDDVQAWQRVLSPSEAHDLASAVTPLAHLDLAEGCAPAMTATPNNPVPSLGGYWPFGEGSGATLRDTSAFGTNATLAGGYTWTTGHAANTNAVEFNGTGYASTAGPVLNTSQSFTVSAWVKPDDLSGYYAVAAQHGTKQDAFQIRYSVDVNRWIFGMTTSDDNSIDNYHWAIGTSTPQAGVWTMVSGVFDSSTMSLKIYVNGRLDGTGAATTVWNAAGALRIGSVVGGLNPFKGAIGQVQAWSQALTADQVAGLAGTTYFDILPRTSGSASGGVTLDAEPDGNGNPTGCAARFDHSQTGQVAQARPANFRTDRSYTVEAWVYHSWTAADVAANGSVGSGSRAVFGVDDSTYSPTLLGYRSWNDANGNPHGKWSLLVSCSATVACGWLQLSDADAVNNTWTHLTATYDAATGQTALYVNGVRQNTPAVVGTSGSVTGWNGSGQLWLGRGTWSAQHSDPWYGGVAGVRLYAGVRTQGGILADRTTDDPGGLFGNAF